MQKFWEKIRFSKKNPFLVILFDIFLEGLFFTRKSHMNANI